MVTSLFLPPYVIHKNFREEVKRTGYVIRRGGLDKINTLEQVSP